MNDEQRALAEKQARQMVFGTITLWTYTNALGNAATALRQAVEALDGAKNTERAIDRHLNIDGTRVLDPTVAALALEQVQLILSRVEAAQGSAQQVQRLVKTELQSSRKEAAR